MSNFTQHGLMITVLAAEDLSANTFAKYDGYGQLAAVDGANDFPAGIVQADAKSGQPASLMLEGIGLVKIAAALAAGDSVSPSANGRGQESASGQHQVGRCLEGASTENSLATVAFDCRVASVKA